VKRHFFSLALIALCFGASGVAAAKAPQAPAPVAATAPEPASQPLTSFVERFQAPRLDPRWVISDRWHSGDWFSTEWRREQIGMSPRGLALTLAPRMGEGPKPYVSAEISTQQDFLYGYFETRFRMPRGAGLVSAFFTFTRPDGVGSHNEIDMEWLGRDPRRLELVYHVAGQANLQVVRLPFDPSRGFHTFAFEWRSDQIRWFADNRLLHTARGGRVGELNRPQRLFASLWNSERMPRWLGRIDPAQAPWTMVVACIAYAPEYSGRALCAGAPH
jgi:beta-glucanase (GH16 family)